MTQQHPTSSDLLIEALRATEWHREDGHGPPQCSVCDGWGDVEAGPDAGHREDCIVGRALGRTPNRGAPELIDEADERAAFWHEFSKKVGKGGRDTT
jgi:hypothetical protein